MGSYRLEMKEDFESGLKNKIEQYLTLFWQKYGQKLAKSTFCLYFGQKERQILSDLNFEARFEILSSFATYMTPFR